MVTVGVNNLSVVHKDSNGITSAFPDVCKTPTPGGPVPIPYPNIAKSSDTSKGTTSVKCDGNPVCVSDSNFMISTGDEPGSLLGVVSNKVKGKAEFVNYSFDVKFEGKGVARAFDLMLHNDKKGWFVYFVMSLSMSSSCRSKGSLRPLHAVFFNILPQSE
jgi:hypothetical protein